MPIVLKKSNILKIEGEKQKMSLKIDVKTLNNEFGGNSYFHPKPTILPGNIIAMTMQIIGGSDYFGPVQVTYSHDNGKSWSTPEEIEPLGWKGIDNGLVEGTCDVVPDYHQSTGKLLAIGHNVYYKDNRFLDTHGYFRPEDKSTVLKRIGVYSARDNEGNWSKRKKIYCKEFEECSSFVCGCTQKVILSDGKVIIPCSIGYDGRKDRLVSSLLCGFDGDELKVLEHGNKLENTVGRGLLEPSIVLFEDKFYLTIRAEDEHGYISTSENGLDWKTIKAWSWEDGTKLTMSTTQQHWLKLGGKLYLVYTRKDTGNENVMRWRAPLYIAEVDTEKLCLKKDTEQIVFPMRPHSENSESIGLMGNFHPLALSETEAIVTVGEMHPQMGYSGDTLLAHLEVR